MTDRPRRARRVQLSTPGSSEKMMQKASESKADHVFLDLEDAVAPSQKRDARKKIVEALKTLNWKGKTRCVRINDLTTEYAFEDIIEIVEGAGEHLGVEAHDQAAGLGGAIEGQGDLHRRGDQQQQRIGAIHLLER